MGRNKKIGLDYFPFDVDFFQDIKIRKLIKYQRGKAVTVYALLLCLIYKNGYYMLWDEELPFILSEQTGFEEAYIQEVVRCCLALGLFSKELFDKEKVLTSIGIQERYKRICDDCRRKCEFSEFNLISSEESTQRKEKDNKENIIIPPTPPKGVEELEKVVSEKDQALNEALARIKDLEEKIAQSKPAKPKRSNGLNANARKAFEGHFRNTFGEEYYWTAKDAGNMSQLLRKLTFSREQKQLPVDDDSVLYALQVFLSSIRDGWLLENFSVANLNSKYNEIISNARKEHAPKTEITNIYEQKRIDSERRKSRLMAEFAEADAKFLAEQEAKRKAVGSTGEIPNTI